MGKKEKKKIMADHHERIERLRDLRFKKIMKNLRPSAAAGASGTAGPSTGRNTTATNRGAQAEFEDNENYDEVGPGLKDEAAARLLQRRIKRNPVVARYVTSTLQLKAGTLYRN